jgi:tripartite-type tricarboxylate transporter receptor subunit TctC
MLKQSAGIVAVHIPYNGGAPAQLGLLSGQVDFNIDNLATAAANIKSGRLRALAVTSAQRSPVLPDVPPMAESLPGFAIDTWWGIIAPAGTPTDTVNRLNQIFTSALNSPELRQRFAALLAEPTPTSAETFGRFMAQERQRYEPVVKASGARVD